MQSYVSWFNSTYDRGGPNTTNSDPSSNLDLDNCYKPINVDEDDDGGDGMTLVMMVVVVSLTTSLLMPSSEFGDDG